MIDIQEEDFDLGLEYQRMLDASATPPGAIVSFAGLVRDHMGKSQTSALTLEHYPGMTEASIQKIIDQAFERWSLQAIRVIHRVGRLSPGAQIVLVMVASAHRAEAFESCEFIMDYLKTEAVIWKKEHTEDGDQWLKPRVVDEQRVKNWSK
ncbi:MAG: molybdenum cofactor biosynthesis protein MoaE [Pseudomonadales bacterium]|nr:molybdenum cofactor biosynthesis protein MoaE [Pseudomonadales bacterium]